MPYLKWHLFPCVLSAISVLNLIYFMSAPFTKYNCVIICWYKRTIRNDYNLKNYSTSTLEVVLIPKENFIWYPSFNFNNEVTTQILWHVDFIWPTLPAAMPHIHINLFILVCYQHTVRVYLLSALAYHCLVPCEGSVFEACHILLAFSVFFVSHCGWLRRPMRLWLCLKAVWMKLIQTVMAHQQVSIAFTYSARRDIVVHVHFGSRGSKNNSL